MSDPWWKQYRSEIKDIKQGVADQPERPQKAKKKIDKPWALVWGRRVYRRYATREQAQAIIDKEARKVVAFDGIARLIGLKFRLVGPDDMQGKAS